MRPALCALVALGLVASAPQAHAGVVFVDRDGDGTQDPDERGRAGVRVVAGDVVATTDAAGRFALAAAPGAIVWARTPADARSVPTWAVMPATGEPQLALTTAPSGGPLTFAVAADSHHDLIPDDGWDDAALDRALAQVAAAAPGARFVALLGDLSQSAFADELDQVATHARAACQWPVKSASTPSRAIAAASASLGLWWPSAMTGTVGASASSRATNASMAASSRLPFHTNTRAPGTSRLYWSGPKRAAYATPRSYQSWLPGTGTSGRPAARAWVAT